YITRCLFFLLHTGQLLLPKLHPVAGKPDAPYSPVAILCYVKRAIRSHGKTRGTMPGVAGVDNRIDPGKAIGKNFPFTRYVTIPERNKSYEVARLGIRTSNRRPVPGNKSAVPVMLGELLPPVKKQIVGCEVTRESQ